MNANNRLFLKKRKAKNQFLTWRLNSIIFFLKKYRYNIKIDFPINPHTERKDVNTSIMFNWKWKFEIISLICNLLKFYP